MKFWKLLLLLLVTLFFFSGCSSRNETLQLRKRSAQQARIIQQQQAQIDALRARLDTRKKLVRKQVNSIVPVKKPIKLKKVEDNNFSSGYMYPQTKSTAKPKATAKVAQAQTSSTSSVMGRAECIGMIGQEKFDKYTKMFGNEAASLKRCKMLKAMKN